MEFDKKYKVEVFHGQEQVDLKKNIAGNCLNFMSLSQAQYEKLIIQTISFMATFYDIGEPNFIIDSSLDEESTRAYTKGDLPVIFLNPIIFRKPDNHYDLYKNLGTIAHEMGHIYDEKTNPVLYEKFTNEMGTKSKLAYIYLCNHLKQILKNDYEIAVAIAKFGHYSYYTSEHEIFARSTERVFRNLIYKEMQTLCDEYKDFHTEYHRDQLEFAKWAMAAILEVQQEEMEDARKFFESEDCWNLIENWRREIPIFLADEEIPFHDFELKKQKQNFEELISKRPHVFNALLNTNLLYDQNLMDMAVDYYLKKPYTYSTIIVNLAGMPNNKNSDKHITKLFENIYSNFGENELLKLVKAIEKMPYPDNCIKMEYFNKKYNEMVQKKKKFSLKNTKIIQTKAPKTNNPELNVPRKRFISRLKGINEK